MSGHVKIFFAILIVGTIAILAFKFTWPKIEEKYQLTTSDASDTRTTVRVGMDNWVGYFPLCSPEMKRRLRSRGIQLKCIDDQANYKERFSKLNSHELEFAVATVDSYLLNGPDYSFPGVIVNVIDESKGGDAIVAYTDKFKNLDDLRNNEDLRIAFTPASPSEHLLKSISTHFDIPGIRSKRGKWRVETNGSSDALDQLLKKKVDVAVLWEPDVSRAISKPGIDRIISTSDTDKLIVDILIAERRFLRDHPDTVESFLKTYFDTLRHYHLNREKLRKDIIDTTGLKAEQVDAMLDGVTWVNLTENAVNWYGITGSGLYGDEYLIDAINASLDVLLDNRDFDASPLPDQDPYRLTNRNVINKLYQGRNFSGQAGDVQPSGGSLSRKFSALSNDDWARLREIGTLRVEPVQFHRGSETLNLDGKKVLDNVAERLKRYPNFRILIKGHSGVRGDVKANLRLSADRASAVARYLQVTYQVDNNRIHSLGFGSSQPLPRKPGESDRAYSYRLPRVEISLVSEAY